MVMHFTRSTATAGRLIASLLADCAGNTLAITAAAAVPLVAMVGGGVDVSRAYMAKTQLQAACDAGVLAGRRAMNLSGEYDEAERVKANRMFALNFNMGAIPDDTVSFETEDNDEGQVWGTATATLPTAVMYIFGMDEVDLNVDCMAELQVANVDAMFVLDTTGSMGGARIAALRDAVRDFHATLADAVTGEETRVRYGFVPYSTTVNVGGLVASGEMPADFFLDETEYQSREALFNTPVHVGTTEDLGSETQTYSSAIRENQCTNWQRNNYPSSGSNPHTTGSAPGKVRTVTYSPVSWTRTSGSRGTCVREASTTETTYETQFAFTRWRYRKLALDTSDFRELSDVTYAGDVSSTIVEKAGWYNMLELAALDGTEASNVDLRTARWNGCIEERATVTDASFNPIPSGAHDLNINLAPEDDDTRWRPMWSQAEFNRGTNADGTETTTNFANASAPCPAPSMLFRDADITTGTEPPEWLDTYLDGLVATGNTYHDIGMIWGARLASPRGLFADNVNEGDSNAVSRHMIFMTDGVLEPTSSGYTAYGIERYDNRIAPGGTSATGIRNRHNARFLAACAQARAMGYTVWVIGFGTALTNDMRNCASDGRAYFANDSEALSNTFRFIASQVANLRLGA